MPAAVRPNPMAAPVSGVVECYEGKRVTTWYARWRDHTGQHRRRLGPAWPHKGPPDPGYFRERAIGRDNHRLAPQHRLRYYQAENFAGQRRHYQRDRVCPCMLQIFLTHGTRKNDRPSKPRGARLCFQRRPFRSVPDEIDPKYQAHCLQPCSGVQQRGCPFGAYEPADKKESGKVFAVVLRFGTAAIMYNITTARRADLRRMR